MQVCEKYLRVSVNDQLGNHAYHIKQVQLDGQSHADTSHFSRHKIHTGLHTK